MNNNYVSWCCEPSQPVSATMDNISARDDKVSEERVRSSVSGCLWKSLMTTPFCFCSFVVFLFFSLFVCFSLFLFV